MKVEVVTKISLLREECEKIEGMIDDIEDFLIEMEKKGLDSNNTSFKHLVDAQDNLEMFLDNTENLDEE